MMLRFLWKLSINSRGNMRWVVFLLGEESYAIEVKSIKEITIPQKITKVPKGEKNLRGIMNLRGTVISVYDLSEKLGLEKENRGGNIIVVEHGDRIAGFLVDEVEGVEELEELERSPIEDPVGVVRGVIRKDDGLIIALDAGKLIE